MAGLGRKVFVANEVLTAADVNGYLMDQAVMVFDDSTARGSAIGTATEGMVTYLKDSNGLFYYDGASWQVVGLDPITYTSSTATAYTVASGDAGSFLRFTDAATLTIGTTTAFSAGQQVQILADGTALSIAGGTGVTLGGAGTAGTALTFSVGGQYEAVSVFCVDTNTYRVIGNVTAA
jgi:hypothetical protein